MVWSVVLELIGLLFGCGNMQHACMYMEWCAMCVGTVHVTCKVAEHSFVVQFYIHDTTA